MTNLGMLLQGEFLWGYGSHIVAGLVAAAGAYGANRFFLGDLSRQVKDVRYDVKELRADSKRHGIEIGRHDERLKAGGL